MKTTLLFILPIIILLTSCDSKIGNYTKEPLPENLVYSIRDTLVNEYMNKVNVNLNQKISIGQIATLASIIYNKYATRKHVDIWYDIPDYKETWAVSNFDPELKIAIIGLTKQQDSVVTQIANNTSGSIVGKWKWIAYYLVVSEKEERIANKSTNNHGNSSDGVTIKKETYIRKIFGNGDYYDYPCVKTNHKLGTKLFPTTNNKYGDYYILKDGILDFYRENGTKFSSAFTTF